MTFMKVIQRSSEVRQLIIPYGFQILSEEPLNQIGDNYVLNRGQMLTEVKCSKVCFTIRSLGLEHHQAIKMVTALKRMLPPNLARALVKGTVMSCFSFDLLFLHIHFIIFCYFLFPHVSFTSLSLIWSIITAKKCWGLSFSAPLFRGPWSMEQ